LTLQGSTRRKQTEGTVRGQFERVEKEWRRRRRRRRRNEKETFVDFKLATSLEESKERKRKTKKERRHRKIFQSKNRLAMKQARVRMLGHETKVAVEEGNAKHEGEERAARKIRSSEIT
jgi:hypothetical protein